MAIDCADANMCKFHWKFYKAIGTKRKWMQNRANLAAIITVSWFNLANITCAHKLCEWYFFAIALIATIWMPLVTFCCSIHCWFQMPTTTLIHTIRKFELFRIIVCTFPALLEYNCVLQTLARKQTEVNFHDRFFGNWRITSKNLKDFFSSWKPDYGSNWKPGLTRWNSEWHVKRIVVPVVIPKLEAAFLVWPKV